MKFNTFKNRLITSIFLVLPSYILLYLVNGAHFDYSVTLLLILITLFEVHSWKSNWLQTKLPLEESLKYRLWAETGLTLLLTPIVVIPFVYLSHHYMEMEIWWPGIFKFILLALSFSLFIAAFVNADVIISQWKQSLIQNKQLEKENIKARLATLQAQISPHFLFNNFNVLNALIDDDPALAKKYLEKLSEIYRYVLNQKEEEIVLLEEEIQFIKDYLFLLNIRFNGHLECSIDIDELSGSMIPPATFQLLVENAIKHNEVSGRKPLSIEIKNIGSKFLRIENKLQPKQVSTRGTNLGLQNLKNRYKYLTDEPVSIDTSNQTFTLTVPLLSY